MNPPRTYDELLAAATKGPVKPSRIDPETLRPERGRLADFACWQSSDETVKANVELAMRYWNHGPEMVAALRKRIVRHEEAEARMAEEELSGNASKLRDAMIEEAALREGADEASAVLAALDGKDAT